MPLHSFGGNWTEEKLERLGKYLPAYMKIFTTNERAQYYTTHYVDAFAGTGSRVEPGEPTPSTLRLFDEQGDMEDVIRYHQGSVRRALEVEPKFDRYLFIERNQAYVEDLNRLRDEYPTLSPRIKVAHGDANEILQLWCKRMDWQRNRAVVFLDSYGMAVNWTTIQALGRTKGVDLWVLIPVGQAINRLLMRDTMPTGAWADRLTAFFGTEEWREEFYRPRMRPTLFGDEEGFEKQANFESIGDYCIRRLRTAFANVADNSLVLLNSRRVPLFMLCFAATNPTGVNIANDVLR